MRIIRSACLGIGALLLAASLSGQRAGPVATKELYDEIAAVDRTFFNALFNDCERQKTGEDYRARRELVEGSLEVYPLNNYGAVEVGVHRFYKKTEGQPDKLVEIARFTQLWKKDTSGWKLARVLSYDHKLTE